MWTLARTISMFGKPQARPQPSPGGTPPLTGVPPGSILIPANQRYLASIGFYRQQGWPSDPIEKERPVDVVEGIKEEDEEGAGTPGNAASKRKMFQKTRSKLNWSLCDSGGEDDGAERKPSPNASDWVTKSLDESLSREDSTGADDSGKFAYFSTTTESSTESIDERNSDTERAFEEIRQQYKEGKLGLLPKKQRSSSEDLFLPCKASDRPDDGGEDASGRSVRFGDLNDENDLDGAVGDGGDGKGEKGSKSDYDFLRASLDSEGNGGKYFISPANSRQATVEKLPSTFMDDLDSGSGNRCDNDDKDDNDNNNNYNSSSSGGNKTEDLISKVESSSLHSSMSQYQSCDSMRSNSNGIPCGNSDVRIVVSNSTECVGDLWLNNGGSASQRSSIEEPCHASKLGVVGGVQRASSDSGSSSSGTAIGITATDDLDTLRLSESENSITDKDSISRNNSPSSFLQPMKGQGYGYSKPEVVSCGVQTSMEDLVEQPMMTAVAYGGVSAVPFMDSPCSSSISPATASTNSSVINVNVQRGKNGNMEFVVDEFMSSEKGGEHQTDDAEFQLSALPVAINPIQLMKRLHRSQDELLPRMGSLQSDSSGFGDGEPGLDSSPVEGGELIKVANLGSSSESSGTVASTATTAILTQPRRGETATQTSLDGGSLVKSEGSHAPYVLEQPTESETYEENYQQPTYISACIIPPRSLQPDKDSLHHRHGISKDDSFLLSSKTSQSKHSQFPQPPYDTSLQDYYYYQQQFCNNNNNNNNLRHFPSGHPGTTGNVDKKFGLRGAWASRNPEAGPPAAFFNLDPAPRGYVPSSQFSDRPYHHQYPYDPHIHHPGYFHSASWLYGRGGPCAPSPDDPNSYAHSSPRRYNDSNNPYTNNDNKYDDDIKRPDRMHSSFQSGLHSDRGRGRNQTPLSEELAEASSYTSPNSHAATHVVSFPSVTSSFAVSTSTPVDTDKGKEKSKVVSSMNVYINAEGVHPDANTPSRAPTTERSSQRYPPLAGNVSGVRTDDSNTTYSQNTAFSSRRHTRQKSYDNFYDEEEDPFLTIEEENLPVGFDAAKAAAAASLRQDDSSRLGYFSDSHSMSSGGQRRVPPVMPLTFSPFDEHAQWFNQNVKGRRSPYPSATPPLSRTWDDIDGYSFAETSSEYSIKSMPATGRNYGALNSQKLARLVNRRPSSRGRRRASSYQPGRSFREWHVLSRRKRLIEEDRLLQHSIYKYRTELSHMESTFLAEYGKAFVDMTEQEREEVHEVEWLWGEVKGQVQEMELLVNSRVQSVHSGNDFHSLLSSLGVIDKTIELLKEQIYQQQVSSRREDGASTDDFDDNGEDWEEAQDDVSSRDSFRSRSSYLSSQSWLEGSWRPSRGARTFGRRLHSSSTSNLPTDINLSLEQMKSSLLKEMKDEIRASTQKLEQTLMKKEFEIQELKRKITLPSSGKKGATSSPSRSSTKVQPRAQAWIARSRSRVMGDRVVRETDI